MTYKSRFETDLRAPSAIANAIEDAIGARLRGLPITAEKVYAALKAKK